MSTATTPPPPPDIVQADVVEMLNRMKNAIDLWQKTLPPTPFPTPLWFQAAGLEATDKPQVAVLAVMVTTKKEVAHQFFEEIQLWAKQRYPDRPGRVTVDLTRKEV